MYSILLILWVTRSHVALINQIWIEHPRLLMLFLRNIDNYYANHKTNFKDIIVILTYQYVEPSGGWGSFRHSPLIFPLISIRTFCISRLRSHRINLQTSTFPLLSTKGILTFVTNVTFGGSSGYLYIEFDHNLKRVSYFCPKNVWRFKKPFKNGRNKR